MPQPVPSCRLTSIQIHLNPQRFSKNCLTEKAGSRSREVSAPSDTGHLHLVSKHHLCLCGHVPLTGCTLSKHSELPRRGELVGHVAGHTVRGKGSTSSTITQHPQLPCSTKTSFGAGGVAQWGEGLPSMHEALSLISCTALTECDGEHLWFPNSAGGGRRLEVQGHPLLHSDFEASLNGKKNMSHTPPCSLCQGSSHCDNSAASWI